MNKRLKIWFCEDDEDMWEHQKEVMLDRIPQANVTHFLNAGYAARDTGSPTYIIIDVGGASGLGCNVASLTRHNIEGLSELHPGAIFVVFSALSFYAEDAFNLLSDEIKAVSRVVEGSSVCNICDIIEEYEGLR